MTKSRCEFKEKRVDNSILIILCWCHDDCKSDAIFMAMSFE